MGRPAFTLGQAIPHIVSMGWLTTFSTTGMFLELANGRGSAWGTCQHASLPDSKRGTQGDCDKILGYLDKHPGWSFTLEQPNGTARHKEIKRLERPFGIQPVEVRMCAYGYKWQKPTLIWHNLAARVLDPVKPDGVLRILQEQHTTPYANRQARRTRRKACGTAEGLHARGLAEQNRPGAGEGVGDRHEGKEEGVEHRNSTHAEGVDSHETQTYNCTMDKTSMNVHRKGSRGGEKKRVMGPKPLNINEQTAWRCGGPGIRVAYGRVNRGGPRLERQGGSDGAQSKGEAELVGDMRRNGNGISINRTDTRRECPIRGSPQSWAPRWAWWGGQPKPRQPRPRPAKAGGAR